MRDRQVLDLGTDQALRHKWFMPQSYSHPAKLHLGLLQWIVEKYTKPGDTLGDPMAGIGGLLMAATLQRNVVTLLAGWVWTSAVGPGVGRRYTKGGSGAEERHLCPCRAG